MRAGGRGRPLVAERRRLGLRSLLVQAVWNYESLQGVGFAWSLLPALERIHPDRRDRAERLLAHLEPFNANPYLAPIGIGVAARLEQEVARGSAGAERRLGRLLQVLRGPLGALGDALFWAAWRPALGSLAALLVVVGAPAWTAVGYLVAYNGFAQAVRFRGVRAGFASGAGIARILQDPFWSRAAAIIGAGGAVIAGAALAVAAIGAFGRGGDAASAGVFFIAVALLWLAGARASSVGRRLSPAGALLVVVALLSVAYQIASGASLG